MFKMFKKRKPILRLSDRPFDDITQKMLNETFPLDKHPEASEYIWKSNDGRETKLRDMATRHIVHTIKLIERGDHGRVKSGHVVHKALHTELAWRKAIHKKQQIKKDRDLSEGGIFFKKSEN